MYLENRIKRLKYRSWHRGCKETDIILGQFSEHGLAMLAPQQLDAYEKLLEEDDVHIWDWVIGKPAPAEYEELLTAIREFDKK